MDSNQSLCDKEQDIKYCPLVTVITPILNGAKYLDACIKSALAQSYPHIEHIFIDGASTDGTVDVLAKYSARYPGRVRYISEPDSGGTEAVNKGILMAKGSIIGFMGSDDTYEPGAIEAVVDFFRANPGAHLVRADTNFIDENGELVGRSRIKDFNLRKTIHGAVGGNAGCSTFYSREIFERLGLFGELVNDLDFMIRVGKVFPIYRIDKVLSNSRMHKGSITWGSWEGRKRQMRDHCIVSRRHGGSIFSGYCMIYYAYVLFDWFRPVFGPIYPFIGRLTGKNIGKTKDDWAVRLKG